MLWTLHGNTKNLKPIIKIYVEKCRKNLFKQQQILKFVMVFICFCLANFEKLYFLDVSFFDVSKKPCHFKNTFFPPRIISNYGAIFVWCFKLSSLIDMSFLDMSKTTDLCDCLALNVFILVSIS